MSSKTSAERNRAFVGIAAPIEADSPKVLTLHDRRLHSELGSANRSDIAAGASPNDNDVEFH
jgi:hypothetical protein